MRLVLLSLNVRADSSTSKLAVKKPVSFQVTALLKKPSETITVAVSCNEIGQRSAFLLALF
jgi:hypothetical protein